MSDKRDTIRVLFVRHGKAPEVMEMENSLSGMQRAVEGNIEMLLPFEEEVALVCNEEGKLDGLPLNRGIRSREGRLLDIVAGNFFLCRAPGDSSAFESLTEGQIKRYREMFRYPEMFLQMGREIFPIKIKEQETGRDSR